MSDAARTGLACIKWDMARREELVRIHERAIRLHIERIKRHRIEICVEKAEIARLQEAEAAFVCRGVARVAEAAE